MKDKMSPFRLLITAAVLTGSITASMLQAQDGPTYKADVPQELLTPDKMQTRYLGELNFQDGFSNRGNCLQGERLR